MTRDMGMITLNKVLIRTQLRIDLRPLLYDLAAAALGDDVTVLGDHDQGRDASNLHQKIILSVL